MKLSIIVVVNNAEAYLRECLDSILGSSLRDIECICVNDASTDSSARILAEFKRRDFRLKIITHSKRHGLFPSRMSGMKCATGEWVGFSDAADLVSPDRLRQLVALGEQESADIAWGPTVNLSRGKMTKPAFCGPQFDRKMSKGEHLQNLLATCGRDPSWCFVCAKIYRRDLTKRLLEEFKNITDSVNAGADILLSLAFACLSDGVCFSTNVEPYLRRISPPSPNETPEPPEEFLRKAAALKSVRTRAKDLLSPQDTDGSLASHLAELIGYAARREHARCPKEHLQARKELKSLFCAPSMHDSLCELADRPCPSNPLRAFKDRINDPSVRIVSFDVFDTLLVRPFWKPTDLFALLWDDFQKKHACAFEIDFQSLRIEAESLARRTAPSPDVTIDDIYDALKSVTGWETSFVDELKAYEIRLELSFCRARRSARDLVAFARNSGKRVIVVSDMYLSRDVIHQLLAKNSFAFSDDDIFVSSEQKKSKTTGELFSFVAEHLDTPPETILHIGDNLATDVASAERRGLQALHLPKPVEQMSHSLGGDGRTLERIFSRALGCIDGRDALGFLGIRCRLALAANFLFDNPFALQTRSGAFDGDIIVLGYFALGLHILAIADWIDERVHDLRLSGIHFLARDGHLPRLAYERLKKRTPTVPCDTWYLNRAFTIALRLQTKTDFLNWLERINLGGSFTAIYAAFRVLLGDDSFAQVKNMLQSRFDTSKSIDECGRLQVVSFCKDEVFPRYESEIHASQQAIRGYLKDRTFGEKDATFDIGYSCRMESVLSRIGIPTTTLYVHLKGGKGLERSRRLGLDTQTFYDYTQSATGLVRELLLSSVEGKCISYGTTDSGFGPIFEKQTHCDYLGGQTIRTIQDAALSFIDDWNATFGEGWKSLAVRHTDASLPFDYFLTYAPASDYAFLKTFCFDDVQGTWNVTLQDVWNKETFKTYADQLEGLRFLKRCEDRWPDEHTTGLGKLGAYGCKRLSRLCQIASRGLFLMLRHPISNSSWLLPYWFLRRKCGDIYDNAFLRIPSGMRNCIPAGVMRLWSEQINRDTSLA